MDYYSEKKRAITLIDEMVTHGKDEEQIYFKIETMFGFSEKFVDKRIARIKKFLERTKDENRKRTEGN